MKVHGARRGGANKERIKYRGEMVQEELLWRSDI